MHSNELCKKGKLLVFPKIRSSNVLHETHSRLESQIYGIQNTQFSSCRSPDKFKILALRILKFQNAQFRSPENSKYSVHENSKYAVWHFSHRRSASFPFVKMIVHSVRQSLNQSIRPSNICVPGNFRHQLLS